MPDAQQTRIALFKGLWERLQECVAVCHKINRVPQAVLAIGSSSDELDFLLMEIEALQKELKRTKPVPEAKNAK